jgi:hypothetical protein
MRMTFGFLSRRPMDSREEQDVPARIERRRKTDKIFQVFDLFVIKEFLVGLGDLGYIGPWALYIIVPSNLCDTFPSRPYNEIG